MRIYEVTIGLGDCDNLSLKTLAAENLDAAKTKVESKLKRNEFVVSIVQVNKLDE